MYVGNLKQWEKEIPYVPAGLAQWIEKLASYDLASLEPGRHDLGGGNYMNVDVGETHPAAERTMEAHRDYIDIQTVIAGDEIIGYQPILNAGAVVEDRSASDAWVYNPSLDDDTVIRMVPGTFAVFTPADGHRCLCAPDGTGKPIKKAIMKIRIASLGKTY